MDRHRQLIGVACCLLLLSVLAVTVHSQSTGREAETFQATATARVITLAAGAPGPHGLYFAEEEHLWVACGALGIAQFDARSGAQLRVIRLPAPSYLMKATRDGRTLLVDSYERPGVWAVDAATGSVLSHVDLPRRVNDFLVTSSGVLFATDAEEPLMWRVDLSDVSDAISFELAEKGCALALGADETKLYVGSSAEYRPQEATSIHVVDTDNCKLLTTLTLESPLALRSLVANASGSRVYFAQYAPAPQVCVVDTESDTVTVAVECPNRDVVELEVDEERGLLFMSGYTTRGPTVTAMALGDGHVLADLPVEGAHIALLRGPGALLAASASNSRAVWIIDVGSTSELTGWQQ